MRYGSHDATTYGSMKCYSIQLNRKIFIIAQQKNIQYSSIENDTQYNSTITSSFIINNPHIKPMFVDIFFYQVVGLQLQIVGQFIQDIEMQQLGHCFFKNQQWTFQILFIGDWNQSHQNYRTQELKNSWYEKTARDQIPTQKNLHPPSNRCF